MGQLVNQTIIGLFWLDHRGWAHNYRPDVMGPVVVMSFVISLF